MATANSGGGYMDGGSTPTEQATEQLAGIWQQLAAFAMDIVSRPQVLIGKAAVIVLILLLAGVIYFLVRRFLSRIQQRLAEAAAKGRRAARRRAQRSATFISLISNIAKWAIFFSAGLWTLGVIGVNLVPVLTGAGIVGVAVSLGAQSLVRDFLSGFFMLLEGQFTVGDYVQIGPNFGLVEEVGLRITVLKDLDNQIHYIPNGTISSVTVYEEHHVDYVMEVEIMQREQAEQAADTTSRVLEDVFKEFPRHLVRVGQPSVYEGNHGATAIKASVWVFPSQEWIVQEELRDRVHRALAAAEIEMPAEVKPRVYLDLSRMPQPSVADEPQILPSAS